MTTIPSIPEPTAQEVAEAEKLLSDLAETIQRNREHVHTEEATKHSFVLPLVSRVLGYDIFDPTEFMSELVADVGQKKGEKIDYALAVDSKPQVLVEVKHSGAKLTLENAGQLYRYFGVTDARIGVLTNGVQYKFYSDLVAPNRMDHEPFLEFNLDEFSSERSKVRLLLLLSKKWFNLPALLETASSLRLAELLRQKFEQEFDEPSDELVKLFAVSIQHGPYTQRVREQFQPLVKQAFRNFIKRKVDERLQSALAGNTDSPARAEEVIIVQPADEKTIVTTDEEMTGFNIVKAIASAEVSLERIHARDRQSYFAVLLDDNSRKTICRLYLNGLRKKHIAFLNEEGKEERYELESLDSIHHHASQIREAVKRHIV